MTTVMTERVRMVRMLVGGFAVGYLLVRLPHLLGMAEYHPARFVPIGVLAHLDEPFSPGVWRALVLGAFPFGVAFTVGWRLRWTAPVFAALLLAVTTYRNSWGQVFHTENLLVLQVIVLAVAYLFTRRDDAFVIKLLAVVTVTTYVLAGWAKLRTGGWEWITGDTLRHQVAYDNVRKAALGAPYSPIGGWAVGHGWLFPPLAVFTLAVELGAPLALVRQRFAYVWCSAAWLFHFGIFVLMAIVFAYPLSGIAFAPLLPVERLDPRRFRRQRVGGPAEVYAVDGGSTAQSGASPQPSA